MHQLPIQRHAVPVQEIRDNCIPPRGLAISLYSKLCCRHPRHLASCTVGYGAWSEQLKVRGIGCAVFLAFEKYLFLEIQKLIPRIYTAHETSVRWLHNMTFVYTVMHEVGRVGRLCI